MRPKSRALFAVLCWLCAYLPALLSTFAYSVGGVGKGSGGYTIVAEFEN